ncbi:hypothetical protein CDAR_438951 [Caerostris darwini]|uniref:Uncharacterized protein n=1 Tax=Caerostris darwini TaxID=1538125 RepID=A0AAV4MJT5_9ARAC|nr:hypothetical protein CDAR_438951 [Caerostris darwini]
MNYKIIPPPYKTISFLSCPLLAAEILQASISGNLPDRLTRTILLRHIYMYIGRYSELFRWKGKMKSIVNIHQLCCNTLQPKFFCPVATGRALRLLGMHRND